MGQTGEHIFADAIVDHALAVDRAAFLRVERSRVVLEILDQRTGLGTLVQDFGFAFIDLAATGHGSIFLWQRAPTLAPFPPMQNGVNQISPA